MTHFVALAQYTRLEIAAAIAAVIEQHDTANWERTDDLADDLQLAITNALADFCQSQNAQFDRARFLQACGVTA